MDNTEFQSFPNNEKYFYLKSILIITLIITQITNMHFQTPTQTQITNSKEKIHYNFCDKQIPNISLNYKYIPGENFYFSLDSSNTTLISLNIDSESAISFMLTLYTNNSNLINTLNNNELFLLIDFNSTEMVNILEYFSNNTVFYDPFDNYYFNVTKTSNNATVVNSTGLYTNVTNTTKYTYYPLFDFKYLTERIEQTDIIVCWLPSGTTGYDDSIIANKQRGDLCFDYYKIINYQGDPVYYPLPTQMKNNLLGPVNIKSIDYI